MPKRVIKPLTSAGKTAVIPPKANRKQPRKFDCPTYAARHLIENFFARLEQFCAIATRYREIGVSFQSRSHE
jgi:transposase